MWLRVSVGVVGQRKLAQVSLWVSLANQRILGSLNLFPATLQFLLEVLHLGLQVFLGFFELQVFHLHALGSRRAFFLGASGLHVSEHAGEGVLEGRGALSGPNV